MVPSPTPDRRPSATGTVLTDLVEYLVVQVPDREALAGVGPALRVLTEHATIRLLDLVAVVVDGDGGAHQIDLGAVDDLVELAELAPSLGGLLTDDDIRLAALALRPGSAGLVLLTEDRWAVPLADAAGAVGGRIVAGERIPAHRVAEALAHLDEHDDDPDDHRGGRR